MSQQVIDVGTAPNAGDGDSFRTACTKANTNFTELYAQTGISGQTPDFAFGWPGITLGTFPSTAQQNGTLWLSDWVNFTATQPTDLTYRNGVYWTDVTDYDGVTFQIARDTNFNDIVTQVRAADPVRTFLTYRWQFDTTYYVRVVGKLASAVKQFRFPLTTRTALINSSFAGSAGVRGVCYSPSNDRMYFSNSTGATVTAVNPATNTVTNTISSVGTTTQEICHCPTNNHLYVTSSGDNRVRAISPVSNTIVATIVPGTTPIGLCFCPSNDRIYVSNSGTNNVSVINPATNSVVATVAVGTAPRGITYCPSNDRVYVTNLTTDNVSVINPATNTVVATFAVGDGNTGVVYVPTVDKLYVVNTVANTVSVVDPHSNTVMRAIALGAGTAIHVCWMPTTNRVYATGQTDNSLYVINPFTDTVVTTIAVGASTASRAMAYCPTKDRIYMCNSGNATISQVQ